jgi:hypothetical protein
MAASAASATLPELGRCVKTLTPRTGEYAALNCLRKVVGNKGNYEWIPGPGSQSKFTALAGEVKLETVGKQKVQCTDAVFTGEYTGPKTQVVEVVLNGCLGATKKKSCQTNPAEQSDINTGGQVEGELGFIEGAEQKKVGIDLKPKSPGKTMFVFTCGGLPPELPTEGEPWIVEGSVISLITPINAGPRTELHDAYRAVRGKQVFEKLEGGSTDVLSAMRGLPPGPAEQTGLTMTGEEKSWFIVEDEEEYEIKAK